MFSLKKMKTDELQERQPKIFTLREVRILEKQFCAVEVILEDTRCILNLLLSLSETKKFNATWSCVSNP